MSTLMYMGVMEFEQEKYKTIWLLRWGSRDEQQN